MRAAGDASGDSVQDFEKVIDRLKFDMPDILRKEPDWDIFSPDFKMIDHTGARLEGLLPAKVLVRFLHKVREQFVVKDDIRINPIIRSLDSDPFLLAEWKVQLGGVELQNSPLDIEAEVAFHLNNKNQIDYMRINNIQANGFSFRFWPSVDLSDDLLTNLKKVKMWAIEVSELKKIKDPTAVTVEPDPTEYEAVAGSEDRADDKSMVVNKWEKQLVMALRNVKDWAIKSWRQALSLAALVLILQSMVGGLLSMNTRSTEMVVYGNGPSFEYSTTIITSRSTDKIPNVQIQKSSDQMSPAEEQRLRQIFENARRRADTTERQLFRDFDVPFFSDDFQRFFDDDAQDLKSLEDMLSRMDNPRDGFR
eukprot:gnl/MRDRNA2_/MRDRNA2_53477_c0_seq2.p1 gnl/MRDRNA2_/MRDRNA2_53477_c0~~gnl/MRDRNA2_/MRDRNA2_53477_c0_seq2.p1  ORF type:complete len:394 (+),score=73.55 gnl/MRDRNA2_/MRDRNA2_53477_c0_seq2:93-1184(+)